MLISGCCEQPVKLNENKDFMCQCGNICRGKMLKDENSVFARHVQMHRRDVKKARGRKT